MAQHDSRKRQAAAARRREPDRGEASHGKELARELREAGRRVSLATDLADAAERLAEGAAAVVENLARTREAAGIEAAAVVARADLSGDADVLAEAAVDGAADLDAGVAFLDRRFEGIELGIETLLDAVHAAEEAADRSTRDRTTIMDAVIGCEDIIDRIRGLVERADVAGVNAALEAGRMGATGTLFVPLSDGMKTASATFMHATDHALSGATVLRSALEETWDRRSTSLDRVRTISVTAKGIRNALEDIAAAKDEIAGEVEQVVTAAGEVSEPWRSIAPVTAGLRKAVEGLAAAADNLEDAFAPAGDITAEARREASGISRAVERLVAGEAAEPGGDAIEDAIDTAAELASVTRRYGVVLGAAGAAWDRIRALEETRGASAGNLEAALAGAEERLHGLTDAAARVRAAVEGVYTRLTDTRSVFGQIVRECRHLDRETEAFTDRLADVAATLRRLYRFGSACADAAVRFETIAMTGGIECARAGTAAEPFAPFCRDCASLAADIADAGDALIERLEVLDGLIGASLRAAVRSIGTPVVEDAADLSDHMGDALDVLTTLSEDATAIDRAAADVLETAGQDRAAARQSGLSIRIAALGVSLDGCRSGLDGFAELLAGLRALIESRYPAE